MTALHSVRARRILVIGAGVGGVSVARGLLRDGHDVTIFDQRPQVTAGGGAITIWSNGATVLEQLGVDMDGTGQLLSSLRVATSTGRELATIDLASIANRLGGPIRMVPRRVLLEQLLKGFPIDRIQCGRRAVDIVDTSHGVRVDFEDGSSARGDLVIGADGLHSMVRDRVGARLAQPTGWCSWQGLVHIPNLADKRLATILIGEHGNLGLWPAGNSELQWWFDLPWSADFVRPASAIDMIRSHFSGWSELSDRVLATLTDGDLAPSPFPHFRHPISPVPNSRAVTLLGDAAHIMPPLLAQGTNQALLDAMVLCRGLRDPDTGITNRRGDPVTALRQYEDARRLRVKAVSWLASLQVSHKEALLKPAAMIPDRLITWALATFLRAVSHRRLAAKVDQDIRILGRARTCAPALESIRLVGRPVRWRVAAVRRGH